MSREELSALVKYHIIASRLTERRLHDDDDRRLTTLATSYSDNQLVVQRYHSARELTSESSSESPKPIAYSGSGVVTKRILGAGACFHIIPSTGSRGQIDPRPYKLFNIKNGLNIYRQDFVTFNIFFIALNALLVYVYTDRGAPIVTFSTPPLHNCAGRHV